MKLQDLAIIFIIIFIPITIVFSYYIELEGQTITIQTDYDERLISATREAIEAFEINTTEWNSEYETLANTKRRNILSSVNVFTESIANKFGIGGTAKDSIMQYIPAIVFTMYDGYYIYTPTYVPESITDDKGVQLFYYNNTTKDLTITSSPTQIIEGENVSGQPIYIAKTGGSPLLYDNLNVNIPEGTKYTTDISNAKMTYKHILKTFVPYTTTSKINGKYYVINYTLDNYVRIYGDEVSKEGYVLNEGETIDWTTVNGKKMIEFKKNSSDTGVNIGGEKLSENIAANDIVTREYKYIENGENIYYDDSTKEFFKLNDSYKKIIISDKYDSSQMTEVTNIKTIDGINYKWYSEGDEIIYYDDSTKEFFKLNDSYKKMIISDRYDSSMTMAGVTSIKEQVNNIIISNFNYIYNSNNEKRYYDIITTRFFTINDKGERFYLSDDSEEYQKILNEAGTETQKRLTSITSINDVVDYSARNYYVETKTFNDWLDSTRIKNKIELNNKNEKIINNIQENLKLSLANYSANSKIDYKLPILTDKDWEQALSNISMITFFQGMKSGLKIYNNYAVATSEENNEYVNEDSLYFIGERDEYYHNFGCDTEEQVNEAYRNTEFNINSYISEGQTNYYYKHVFYDEGNTAIRKCFNCIVNRNLLNISANTIPLDLKYRALAREKYIQMGRTKLIN